VYGNLGDLTLAEQQFRQAVRIDAKNVVALLGLGKVFELRREYVGANECYAAAMKYAPDTIQDTLLAARLLHPKAQFTQDVVAMLQRLVRDHPYCGPAHLLLFKIAMRRGDVDGAVTALESIQKIKPVPDWVDAQLQQLRQRRQAMPPAR
jgi:cytochrome c-type biogenesis protein CcmH/NrfG